MMTKNLSKKHSKFIFTIDYTDELLKEKRTYEAIAKSNETLCKHIVFPSITRPSEMPPNLLQDKGIDIRHSRDLPSVACSSDYKLAVLQRSQHFMPLFLLQI